MTFADVHELSTHLPFVQRLARGLCGQDGDDIAQESLVRAWSKAPRDCRSVRGWLSSVVENLAHNQRRSNDRRTRHEARAARVDSVPPVDEIVAREEVRTKVVAAVLELPQGLRDVVLLRFYEGLDSNAIATIVGAPPSTVRSRLQQGLTRLRTRLDAQHRDRAAWMVPLAAWQRRTPAPTPWTSVALRVAVGWRAAAAVAIVLTLLLLVPWLPLGAPPATPGPAPTFAAEPVARASTPHEAAPQQTERTAANLAPPAAEREAASPGRLWGRVVVASTGEPFAGARVALHHRPSDEFSILDRQAAERSHPIGDAVTDRDGRFAFDVARARQYRLQVAAHGFAEHVATNVTGGSEVVVALRAAASLRGHVTRDGGAPLGDATVFVVRQGMTDVVATTTTASDGSFFLGDLPPTALLAAASAPGCVIAHAEITLRPGEVGARDFALRNGRTVSGQVRDATTGAPVAGALVSHTWTQQNAVATGPDGRYTLSGLGELEQLHVRCRGYVAAATIVPTQVEAPQLDFDLVRGATLRGRVVDGAGNGLGEAFVAAARDVRLRSNRIHTAWCTAVVDADGRFVVDDVGPSPDLQITVRCPGHGARTLVPPMPLTAGAVHDLGELVLQAEALLEGVVVDVDGLPIADADVHLLGRDRAFAMALPTGSDASPIFPFAHRHTRSAADGAFRIAGLAGGDYDLSITQPGKEWSHEQAVPDLHDGELRTDLRIVLDVGRVLAGRVQLPGAGLLPADCRMALVARRDGEELHWAKVERDGSFTFERLPGTTYHISAMDVPAGLAMVSVPEVTTGRGDVTFALVPAVPIEGRVVDAQDRALRGVAVSFWQPGETIAKVHTTNGDGAFRIEVAPNAIGRLSASDPDNVLRQVRRDDVRSGDTGVVLKLP